MGALQAKVGFTTALVEGRGKARRQTKRVVHAGTVVDEKDPVVKGRENLFEPVEESIERARNVGKITARTRAETPAEADARDAKAAEQRRQSLPKNTATPDRKRGPDTSSHPEGGDEA